MPKRAISFSQANFVVKEFMMCSPRELHLPNAPQKRGVIELSEDQVVGTPFDSQAGLPRKLSVFDRSDRGG